MWSAGFQPCCVSMSFMRGTTFPESICDRSAPHLTMTQLHVGCCGAQICPGPLCLRLQCFLGPSWLPYSASVKLNPVAFNIDFFKCHLIQRVTAAFSKAQTWPQCSSLSLVLPVALRAVTQNAGCVLMSPDVVLLCFSVSLLRVLADLRHHPSPTAGSVTAASSASTGQGKPSLRRIKGRIHRSKSLDSIDLLDSNVSKESDMQTLIINCID